MPSNGKRYLVLRGLKWWFKRDIPQAIRGAFGGTTAYLSNLQTSDLRVAQKRRDELANETDKLFLEARHGAAQATQDRLRSKAEGWAQEIAAYREAPHRWAERVTGSADDDAAPDPFELAEHEADRIRKAHGPEEEDRFLSIVHGRRPVEDHIDGHLREASIEEKSKGERRAAVLEFAAWCKGKRLTLPDITRRVAGEYVSAVLVPMNRKTGSKRLSNVKRYWDWLIQRGHVSGDNPWERQTLPALTRKAATRRDDTERPFTDDEIRKLLTASPGDRSRNHDRLHDAMQVAALSGMRIEEICRLRVMDCADGSFRIHEGKTASSNRVVPIHSALVSLVTQRIKGKVPTDRLFSDVIGKGMSFSDPLSKQFGRFIRDIDVAVIKEGHRRSKVNFHSFRRWFITKAEQAGTPPHIISTVVGHSEGRKGMTLGVYSAGPGPDQLRSCVEGVQLSG